MSESTKLIFPLPTNDIIVAAMNAKTDSSSRVTTIPAIPQEAHDNMTIISGTKEKQRILEAYETKFGAGYPDSIIMRKKGKLIDTMLLSHSRTWRMRPSKDKFYRVDILELHSIIASIIQEFRVEFKAQDIRNLCLLCKDFASLVPKITRWLMVDFFCFASLRIIMSNRSELTHNASKWQVQLWSILVSTLESLSDGWEVSTPVIIVTSRRL
jgi:hypothetical protein